MQQFIDSGINDIEQIKAKANNHTKSHQSHARARGENTLWHHDPRVRAGVPQNFNHFKICEGLCGGPTILFIISFNYRRLDEL